MKNPLTPRKPTPLPASSALPALLTGALAASLLWAGGPTAAQAANDPAIVAQPARVQRQAPAAHVPPAAPSLQPAGAGQRAFAGELWNRTELYFGTARQDAPAVTEAEFQSFVDDEVTPRFPDGLTLLTGFGQFRSSSGALVKERSMVLILFYPLGTRDANRKVQEVRAAYKRRFQQESVLRTDSLVLLSF